MDVVVMGESLLRLILIASLVATLLHARGTERRVYLYLFVAFVTMTFYWSIGTTNLGQAVRHHVLTNWVVLAGGGPALILALTARAASRWRDGGANG